jgi:hypothetical protein
LVVLHGDGRRVADGRTRNAAEVVACARAWLANVEVDQLVREVSFVDEKPRAMRALAKALDSRLRWDIGPEPGCELWIYGEGRSCKVVSIVDGVACSFLTGQAQVAHGRTLRDVPAAVSAWLVSGLSIGALRNEVAGVELERYAEVLEVDPARWHWLHLRDRIADADDVLAPLRDLVEALAARPIVAAFYSFSSLNRLCFSASSHYPWVNEGLPSVVPANSGTYLVADTRCDLRRAVEVIEARLAAAPVRPFFGSEPHYELPILSERLAKLGSPLRPELMQRGAWYRLSVSDHTHERRCTVSGRHVSFMESEECLDAIWTHFEDGVDAIRDFCERGRSLNDIARDSRAEKTWMRDARV